MTLALELDTRTMQQRVGDVSCNWQLLQLTTMQGPRSRSVTVRHLLSPCAIASLMVWDTLIACASAVLRDTQRSIQAEDQA